jgi:aspartyl-tRNA synthetase
MVVEQDELRSPVAKFLTPEELTAVKDRTKAEVGDLILIVADKADRVAVALDGLRRSLAVRLDLIPKDTWAFCWQTDQPMFEWSEDESKWVSVHHLFTAPKDPNDLDPATAIAQAYDLVLNGFELGGGSIRIHRADVQRRVCELLGLAPEEIDEKFGHLLEALGYGAPPHGGVAFGWDRVVMLLADQETITEVIAFPKTQSGADPLTGAPAPVSEMQLRDLGIRLAEPPKEP